MEELQALRNSETNLTDSWTLVNNNTSDPATANGEVEEASDAESLEVLEVEHGETNPDVLEEETSDNAGSEHHNLRDPNESDGSVDVIDIPVIQIVATQRMRKYTHHPNAFINMWLSIMMVVAIAVTLGLGMGHYLGTKRYSKATDIIQHLQCKNHMLEMEYAKLVSKHKTCERNLYDTENIFNILVNANNDVEFPVEGKSKQEDSLLSSSKKTNFSSPQLDPGEKGNSPLPYSVSFFNQNVNNISRTKGDLTISSTYFSFGKFKEISKQILSPRFHMPFAELNNEVRSLNFLLKKWNQYINKNKPISDVEHKRNYNCEELSSTTEVSLKSSCKGISEMNNEKSCSEIPECFKIFLCMPSQNNCCRSQLSWNKKIEDKSKLRGERNKLSGSVFYIPFKENKLENLAHFPGICIKSSLFLNESDENNLALTRKLWKNFRNKQFIGDSNYEKLKGSNDKKYSKHFSKYNDEGGNFMKQKNSNNMVHNDKHNFRKPNFKKYDKTIKHSKDDKKNKHFKRLHLNDNTRKIEEKKIPNRIRENHSKKRGNYASHVEKWNKFHRKLKFTINEAKLKYRKSPDFPKKDKRQDKNSKYDRMKGKHKYFAEKHRVFQKKFEDRSKNGNKKKIHEKIKKFASDENRKFIFKRYTQNEKSDNRNYYMNSLRQDNGKNKKYHEKKKPLNSSGIFKNEKDLPDFNKMKLYNLQFKTFKAYNS